MENAEFQSICIAYVFQQIGNLLQFSESSEVVLCFKTKYIIIYQGNI